jgi:phosphoribosylformimino-5-aminoimidazole carboxamide ribotide isomerase
MLSGPSIELYNRIMSEIENIYIIASGGVHTIEDIKACKKLGLYGTICGKSIYKGTLDLREAVECAGQQ